MITKPEDATPQAARINLPNGFGTDWALCFTVEETIEIAMAYAQSILDGQSGAYDASKEQERWLDRFSRWMDKKG